MAVGKRVVRLVVLGAVTIVLITAFLAWFPGVWLPDLGGRVTELCSAETTTGDKFKVTQFWGNDFYTIRFDHWSPDGSGHTHVIESDAKKHWRPCTMQLQEPERKLRIDLQDGDALIDYRWAEKKFVLPPGRTRLRD